MLFKDFYGRDNQVPAIGIREARILKATPVKGKVYAEIVALREYRLSSENVTTDGNGVAMRRTTIELAHANPAVVEGERARDVPPNVGPYSKAETFSLADGEKGTVLGGGSKIGPGGPVDAFWIVGRYDDMDVISDVLMTGIYSSDITAGAEFRLRYID